MKLQIKILLVIIPFMLISLLTLGLWSFNEAKKTTYLSHYRYMRVVLESYTDQALEQNYQLLKEAKMDQVESYVESYQQDAIHKASILTETRGGHVLAINEFGKLIFCTQGLNPDNIELSWNEISKKIVVEDLADIIEGAIGKKTYDDVYVAQYFKPWGWVVFYSIPDEGISGLVNRIRLITLGMIVLCTLVSSFLFFLFSKQYLLRPIAKLKNAALSIAAHENIEIISVNSTDELGSLARSMENMSRSITHYKAEQKQNEKTLIEKHEELQKSQVELKQHQNSLEQLVDERTFELTKSEARLQAILDNSPALISIKDLEGNIIVANRNFEILNLPPLNKFIGKNVYDLFPKDIADTLWQNDLTVLKSEKPFEGEETVEHKDGSNHTYLTLKFPVYEDGDTPFGICAISTDITERKKFETDLKHQALAMNNSSDTIIITDKVGVISYANPAFEKTTGYSCKEIIGQNISIIKSGTHDKKFYEELWETISRGDSWSGHIINKKKSGSQYIEEASISPVYSDNDEIINYVAVKRDISDRLKLEARLQQAQKMESIGNLAGGIAHDFNNILSSIIGFTELALGGAEKGTELEDDLQEVRMAGLRAKDLVKQILTFARQSDELVKPIQINAIAEEVLKFIKSSIPSTIQITTKIISDSFIMGSSTQVHQVLMNLCTNAAHAMDEKGGILDVSVNDITINRKAIPGLIPGEYIELKVADTGMGISPQNIHTIFEPYFTTKSVGEGTGMGLAVVHGIVEKYDGQITVDSTIGEGTCFTIYLPITKKRKVHVHSEKEYLPAGTENILFVDDEAPIVKMGSKALEQLGYSVTTRTSSIEALELFRSKPQIFDLVVTDMTMPNMTGDKLAGELMKIRSDILVILCTGYGKKISQENAAEIGIKAVAFKPIVKADLAKTVRKVLDESKVSS